MSKLSICSKAFVKIGAKTISSFNEGTTESEIAQQLYASSKNTLLSIYPWHFATSIASLNRLDEKPMSGYSFVYQLPLDFLRALSLEKSDYRIYHKTIHTNDPMPKLTYIHQVEEDEFPPFFEDLLVSKLAFEFCLPLTESTSRTEFLEKNYQSLLNQAKLIDSQQNTPIRINDFSLIGVRS